ILQLAGVSDSINLTFQTSSTGTVRLDQSQSYSGIVTGYSDTTNFDLSDINYALGSTTAVYVGDETRGTLTVKDASNHTAHVALQGDYTSATWLTATDHHGGTTVAVQGAITSPTGISTGSVTEAGGVSNGTPGTPTATGTLAANVFQAVAPGAIS